MDGCEINPVFEFTMTGVRCFMSNILVVKLAEKSQTHTFEILCSREVGYYFEVVKKGNG